MKAAFVNDMAAHVKDKAGIAASHGRTIVDIGMETAMAGSDVVRSSVGDVGAVWIRTRSELRFIALGGVRRIREQLFRLTTPTHEQIAVARKQEVKEKKRRRTAARRKPAQED